MRNKRVLFVSEASWLPTGYSVYTKEVLSRLNDVEGIEVAEISCFADVESLKNNQRPWKAYANKPLKSDDTYQKYQNSPTLQFGDMIFNQACLDFKPDFVMDIRDWWMCEFEQRSPFRKFFHWAIMPTVDAFPQNDQWMNTYASADSVFSYSEFGRDVLLSQCEELNFVDIAPPSASHHFKPVEDKDAHKESFGISKDVTIIGTVMRNQRRKLYPDLFKCFRKTLDTTKNNNLFLHCHTYYPDSGWDIPGLIQQYGLSGRVTMTYKCRSCNNISVETFQNSMKFCNKCRSFNNHLVGVNNPIDEEELAKVYNIFDLYVQYANSEGFGMPQLEAANCGIPVVSVRYSAMESIIDSIGAWGIDPLTLSIECETGCNRAIPDNEALVNLLCYITNKDNVCLKEQGEKQRKKSLAKYSWDSTAKIWENKINEIELKDYSETWHSPLDIKIPSKSLPENLIPTQKVDYLFDYVLHKPEMKGGFLWRKILKDLTFGFRRSSSDPEYYYNESHVRSVKDTEIFSFQDAHRELYNLRNQINQWEEARGKIAR